MTRVFKQLTQVQAQALAAVQNSYDINTRLAIMQYIRKDLQSNQFGVAQNLNHKLENGLPLNATEQYIVDHLDRAMHPLGHDVVLYRAAHADVLEALGLKNYEHMTNAQLNAALSGAEYTEKKYVSTAYNQRMNPFIGGSQSGGREVYIQIHAPSNTKCVMGNMQQAEVILDRKNTRYRVRRAYFNGEYATPQKTGRTVPRVVLEVDLI